MDIFSFMLRDGWAMFFGFLIITSAIVAVKKIVVNFLKMFHKAKIVNNYTCDCNCSSGGTCCPVGDESEKNKETEKTV